MQNVKEEANKLITYVEKNLGRFYPDNTEGYVFARGVCCPKCGGLIPLIHDSEIARKYYIGFYFNVDEKEFTPHISKFKTDLQHVKRGIILCPYCRYKIKKTDAYKIWTRNHIKTLNDLIRGELREEILSAHILFTYC